METEAGRPRCEEHTTRENCKWLILQKDMLYLEVSLSDVLRSNWEVPMLGREMVLEPGKETIEPVCSEHRNHRAQRLSVGARLDFSIRNAGII